jgi:hypothetical protein
MKFRRKYKLKSYNVIMRILLIKEIFKFINGKERLKS